MNGIDKLVIVALTGYTSLVQDFHFVIHAAEWKIWMLRLSPSSEDLKSSLKLKEVQLKLDECKAVIEQALAEVELKFPKSIFDNIDMSVPEEGGTEMNESEPAIDAESASQFIASAEDRSSERLEVQSSIPELSPPTSPAPGAKFQDKAEMESNYNESLDAFSQSTPFSPGQASVQRKGIKKEMMRLFKISTGAGPASETRSQPSTVNRDTSEIIPLLTSVPREPKHSLLLLFRLELPKVLGTVTRIAVNADGWIAGCTVHGEIFVFSKIPYSRFPDAMTRGHDGGVVSLMWLSLMDFRSFFITTGTDKKSLLWEVTADGIEGPHFEIHHPAVPSCCCEHPVNKDIVIFGLLDSTFAMYKIERADESARLTALGIGGSVTKPITALCVSPDGRRLVIGSSVGTIALFDLNTMSLDVEVDCRNRQGKTSTGRKVVGLHWSRDSTCVLVTSCDSRIRVVLVSDLSRRTKFKSPLFVNENLFLAASFGPPVDERIICVSETGNLCIWSLHTRSETNERCLHCNLVTGNLVNKLEKSNVAHPEITASAIIPATHPYCTTIQEKTFALGDAFNDGVALVVCDTTGNIRIFAELFFQPSCLI